MRSALAIVLGLIFALQLMAQPPAKLKPGDTLAVRVFGMKDYDGEYVVMTDGAVAGVGFGRLVVGGRTLEEAKQLIVDQLRRTLRDPQISVFVKEQRKEFVFISGTNAPQGGAIEFIPGMDLRQLVATLPLPVEPDLFEVHLFRPGREARVTPLVNLLDARMGQGNERLLANDVVALLPRQSVRVWIAGAVARPGEYLLPVGADPYQAIARAEGLTDLAQMDPETTVVVRTMQGEELRLPVMRDPSRAPPPLRAGDTVSVTLPEFARVTVAGEVREPGEFAIRAGSSVAAAVARASGLTEFGTLQEVLVFRRGETYRVDATRLDPAFMVQTGDLVVVRRNDRVVLVLGESRRPGPVRLQDGRDYRLADIVAEAGGLTERGSSVRVYLGRPDPDGKLVVTEVRLDRFMKDGRMEDNPSVGPGDVVVIGQPKGLTATALSQAISGSLLLDTLLRR